MQVTVARGIHPSILLAGGPLLSMVSEPRYMAAVGTRLRKVQKALTSPTYHSLWTCWLLWQMSTMIIQAAVPGRLSVVLLIVVPDCFAAFPI